MKHFQELHKHKYYKHRDCMDVFIGIDNIQYIGEHMIKMKATWYVLGSESWWPVSNTAKLELTKEQLEGWYQYVPPKDYKYG